MRSKRIVSLITAAALTLAGGLAGTAPSMAAPGKLEAGSAGKSQHSNSVYIVRMADDPVVAYDGKIKGYAATKPKKGQKIDPDNPNVGKYFEYLSFKHDGALQKVGGANKLYDYGYVFNGFAAELNEAQVAKLQTMDGVLSVEKDEARALDTSSTPTFLGLTGDSGFWSTKAKGENVIIGIVDGGIWPEHPSFSDRTGVNGNGKKDGKLDYQQIPGWHGKCTPGENFTAANCNQKLIGARYYNAGPGGNTGVDAKWPWEYNSPRDYGGHGTHTASTSGGNAGVQATGLAAVFGKTNGIAPRARIAAYKVCWETLDPALGGCYTSDSVAAIDQAVADGVDVINYSISGTRTNFRDSVEIAFLFAADAGVFVATSAGNSGPTSSTVAHPGPWLTTVAAGTHNRNGAGSATLGNGTTMYGASYANALGPRPLVRSRDAGLTGADVATLALCYGDADDGTPRLDASKVTGKIVVCERGGNVLVNKVAAVKAAGGVGMILANTPTSNTTQLALLYDLPAVHLAVVDYAALDAYAQTAGATATINQASIVLNAAAPFTASFSSRGPLQASGSLLKPDLIAPGQDILAGVAPPGNGGRLFDLYSGTSMSSPHVAGLAALMKELHPGWSPMAIKSALMTTAGDVLDGPNTSPVVIFRQGAGHVRPNNAADPGLVFDAGWSDWLGFLCGTQLPTSFCTGSGIPVLDPSDYNSPSIAIGALPGSQTITRQVTNVGGSAATYTPTVSGMVGFTVTINPASLTLGRGETKPFSVTFTRTTAALNSYTGGQLTWSDGSHSVRVPIVARPVALAAPTQVSGSYNVTFGYNGAFTATARGLIPAVTQDGSVSTGGYPCFAVSVPAGASYARFSLFDANVSAPSDLDLEVYNHLGSFVGSSGSATSEEEFNVLNPGTGTWYACVYGYDVPAGPVDFTLFAWALGTVDAGNMTVSAPASATLGGTGVINLSFSGLAAGTKYLGSVVYAGAAGMPNPTIVRKDTP